MPVLAYLIAILSVAICRDFFPFFSGELLNWTTLNTEKEYKYTVMFFVCICHIKLFKSGKIHSSLGVDFAFLSLTNLIEVTGILVSWTTYSVSVRIFPLKKGTCMFKVSASNMVIWKLNLLHMHIWHIRISLIPFVEFHPGKKRAGKLLEKIWHKKQRKWA